MNKNIDGVVWVPGTGTFVNFHNRVGAWHQKCNLPLRNFHFLYEYSEEN